MVGKSQQLDVALVFMSSARGPFPRACSATQKAVSSSLGYASHCPRDCSEVFSSLCTSILIPTQQRALGWSGRRQNGSRAQAFLDPWPREGWYEEGRDGEHYQLADGTGTLEAGTAEYQPPSLLCS